nr:hypothetical protein BaRGS_008277 [Batillaria attramentaria]
MDVEVFVRTGRLMDIRPPWQGPDSRPKDVEQSKRLLLQGANPNDPVRPKSDEVMHNKWGILKSQHQAAVTARSLDFEIGMDSKRRRDRHRVLMAGEDYSVPKGGRQTLKESVRLQTFEEKRMEELVNTDWMPPTSSIMKRSIGLFCHADEPGQLCVAHGCTVTLDTVDSPVASNFFEAVANHILPPEMGGQFDIFVPLAASEEGMEMLVQLSVKTSMQFSSPTGIIGNYNHAWLIDYDRKSPPEMYFCTSKLQVWANVADQAQEAMTTCHEHLAPYFEKTHRDIVAQLTGQVIFDVLGQTDIQGVHSVTQTLKDGLKALGEQKNVNPLEFLGEFLLQHSDAVDSGTLSRQQTLTSITENDDLNATKSSTRSRRQRSQEQRADEDMEVAGINGHRRQRSQESEGEEDLGEDEEGDEDQRASADDETEREITKDSGKEKATKEERNQMRRYQKTASLKTQELSVKFGTMRATKTERLTARQFADHPEKRTPVAFEILASETEYMRTLKAINDVYVRPLKSAVASNRAIIGSQNIQIIFTDIMNIYKVSRGFTEDLQNRMADWDAQHTCLGDIFIKFCSQIKVYANFANNYEVILRCIERCKEQTPAFRAFLERHERALLEANRYLIKHLDAAHLRPPTSDAVAPELRVFQRIATLGLYLFNDALVITRRTSKHFPFSRAVEYTYKFESSVSLTCMQVIDIPDSKFAKNAFRMTTQKREWVCSTETPEQKFNWVALLEQTIRGAITKK